MSKPIVLLDCDGPLAGFTQAYLDALFIETGARHLATEVDRWKINECPFFEAAAKNAGFELSDLKRRVDKHVSRPGFCEEIQVQPGAKEAVARLKESAEIYVVTSPWDSSPTWMYERLHWIHRHFGIARNHVIQTGKKIRIHGDFFVDDKLSHAVEWATQWPNGYAYLFDMHHNQSEGLYLPVVRASWQQIILDVTTISGPRKSKRDPVGWGSGM